MFKNIAVAYDGHPESIRAFRRALELAKMLGISLKVLTIAEPLPAYTAFSVAGDSSAIRTLEQDRQAFYEDLIRRAANEGNAEGIEVSAHTLEGNIVQAVTEFVGEHDVDLLVVGLHRRALRISSLWSMVYSLAQDLTCSVLGVH
jgi:nucleotide-binding universal stress UspA family protein